MMAEPMMAEPMMAESAAVVESPPEMAPPPQPLARTASAKSRAPQRQRQGLDAVWRAQNGSREGQHGVRSVVTAARANGQPMRLATPAELWPGLIPRSSQEISHPRAAQLSGEAESGIEPDTSLIPAPEPAGAQTPLMAAAANDNGSEAELEAGPAPAPAEAINALAALSARHGPVAAAKPVPVAEPIGEDLTGLVSKMPSEPASEAATGAATDAASGAATWADSEPPAEPQTDLQQPAGQERQVLAWHHHWPSFGLYPGPPQIRVELQTELSPDRLAAADDEQEVLHSSAQMPDGSLAEIQWLGMEPEDMEPGHQEPIDAFTAEAFSAGASSDMPQHEPSELTPGTGVDAAAEAGDQADLQQSLEQLSNAVASLDKELQVMAPWAHPQEASESLSEDSAEQGFAPVDDKLQPEPAQVQAESVQSEQIQQEQPVNSETSESETAMSGSDKTALLAEEEEEFNPDDHPEFASVLDGVGGSRQPSLVARQIEAANGRIEPQAPPVRRQEIPVEPLFAGVVSSLGSGLSTVAQSGKYAVMGIKYSAEDSKALIGKLGSVFKRKKTETQGQ
jgi:hypothetical protein